MKHLIEAGRCKAFYPIPIDVIDIGKDSKLLKAIHNYNWCDIYT
jgi:hypothetical protein